MSRGNPVIKKTIAPTTRQVENQSVEQQISDIETQLRPFKRMELPGADNGERILEASNIVIPNA
jgi:transcriptional regulator NrdR family protein